MTRALTAQWGILHRGNYFVDPSILFLRSEMENLLRHLSIGFAPGHGEQFVDFSRLSDGQQSILYLSIVLGMQNLGARVLSGELADAFDVDKLRPAIFTLIAVEEPENSLSPHYLGRVVRALEDFAQEQDAQALLATHSPSLMRRELRRAKCRVSVTWRAPCLRCPLPAFAAGRAGARPDHSITGHLWRQQM